MSTANEKEILAEYFPSIRSRAEVMKSIREKPKLMDIFRQWRVKEQEEFLDFCSGARGVKVVYDGIFKEIFNPELTPERLEDLLSILLGKEVMIEAVLPNDSVRLGAESSLLYTDIIIQQKDGSLSNVEIQKIGYAFPGQRSACYSADHLLRQYKRVRGENNKHFDYRNIKTVYTIIFFECSPKKFHEFPQDYLHVFRQRSNTGLELELLQEYYFIPLDIFRENMDNKPINGELEAWLAFLSCDDPERIVELVTRYPKFKAMYRDIYEICQNTERVMNVYTKELQELDANTVRYMMDEMQSELDQKNREIKEIRELQEKSSSALKQKDIVIQELQKKIQELQSVQSTDQ